MDSHKVLGVLKDASEEQVQRINKVQEMGWHDDRQHECSEEVAEKFIETSNIAHSLLMNLHLRYSPHAEPTATHFDYPQTESPQSSPSASPALRTSSLPKSDSLDSNSSGSQNSVRSDTVPPSFASFTCSEASSSPPLSTINSQHRGLAYRSQSISASSFLLAGPLPTEGPAGSGPSDMPTHAPSRLKKQSRPPSLSSNRNIDFTPRKSSPRRNAANAVPGDPECSDCVVETLRPGRAILSGAGGDSPKKWVHVLNMTLEELFHGKVFHFRILRYTRVGKKRIVPVDIHIPPGTRSGTEILIPNIGHERRDLTRQDVAFLVKEKDHPRFTRIQDDLVMEVRLPWLECLATEPGNVYLRSVDDHDYIFCIEYCKNQLLNGITTILGSGMPHRNGDGRGKIIVKWEISPPSSSSWDTLKLTLGFKGRGG